MKWLPAALVLAATAALAQTPPPVPPARPSPVVSPLTNATSQSGQALLDQINGTIRQRIFEHQVLTQRAQPVAPPILITPTIIRAK